MQLFTNVLCIYNNNARGGRRRSYKSQIREYFQEKNIKHTIIESKHLQDAKERCLNAKKEGYDALFSIGGDGTGHHVANYAIEQDLLYGIIPAGSGNDFAYALGIGGSLQNALNLLFTGREERLNIVKVKTSTSEYYSINITDAGLGAYISIAAQKKLKWLAGNVKYDILGFLEMLKVRPFNCKIIVDGKILYRRIYMMLAGLGQTNGSGMNFLPEARFTNKKMNVLLLNSSSSKLKMILSLKRKVRSGKHFDLHAIESFKANSITLEPINEQNSIPVESEGEYRGNTPVSLNLKKEGIRVLVPKYFKLTNGTTFPKKTYLQR